MTAAPKTESAPPLLHASGLAFQRNDEPIFGPIDLHVHAGEALLIEGANGSGKTTLLRVLAGLLQPGSGTVTWSGQHEHRQSAAGRLALLGHQPGHKGELSCLENLQFARGVYGSRAAVSESGCLREVGLGGYEDHPARALSAGQKKRLALARLRLIPAPLWLLDEPFANLDLPGIDLVNLLVQRHLESGGGALMTSHGAYATGAYQTRLMRLETCRG